MQIQTRPQISTLRNNYGPGGGGPEKPKSYFKERFTASTENTSHKTTDILFPINCMLLASNIGSAVGGQFLGSGGAMLGGFGGSILGYRFGAQHKDTAHNLVDKFGSGGEGKHAAVSTVMAGLMGGATIALATRSLSAGAFGLGAGVAVAGIAGWGTWKATR